MDSDSISPTILLIISGLGIVQGILLAFLVYLHPKSDRSVNLFLSLYIFSTSMVMSLPFFFQIIPWYKTFFLQPIPLLPGPLLYLYLRSFKETITWRKAWPHFVFFLIFFVPTYINLTHWGKLKSDEKLFPKEVLRAPLTLVIVYSRLGQQILYYLLSRKTLIGYQKSILQLYSETSRINMKWARFLVNGFFILIATFVVIFPLMITFPHYVNTLLMVNMAIATPYIYLATYKGIAQPTLWRIQPGTRKEVIQEEIEEVINIEVQKTQPEVIKSSKPAVPKTRIGEITERITSLMEIEKLYQEPELTLQQLADKIDAPSYQVSMAINEGLKKNFYDLVNGYRVEEAKRLLLDPKNTNFTILSVGFEAGFNSKTTFNTVFKKFTGYTPTEYRDKQKNSSAKSELEIS